MSLIRRMLGPAGVWLFDEDSVRVDIGFIVRALILFEKFIINSTRLKEIPSLVSTLGYDDTLELLSSGSLRVYCSSFTVAQLGQTDIGKRRSKGILPLGSYSFGMPRAHDTQAYVSRCLQDFSRIPGLSQKQVIKLKGSLSKVLDLPPEDFGQATLRQLESDPPSPRSSARCCGDEDS